MEQSGKCLAQTPKLFGHAPKPCQTTAKPHPNCLAQTPKLFGFVSKLFGPTSKLFGLLWPNIAKLFGRQSQKYMPDHSESPRNRRVIGFRPAAHTVVSSSLLPMHFANTLGYFIKIHLHFMHCVVAMALSVGFCTPSNRLAYNISKIAVQSSRNRRVIAA